MTIELWLTVLGLAMLDTLSPTTLAVTIVVLLSGRAVATRTLLYLGTLATCYASFGAALMLGLDVAVDPDTLMDESLDPAFFAAGVLLLIASFGIDPGTKAAKEQRRHRAAERAAARRRGQDARLRDGGALVMVGLGVTTFALEFTTVVPYLAAIGLMTAAEVAPRDWVAAIAAYNLVMVLPSLGLLAAKLAVGERLHARFDGWAERLDAAARPAAAWVVGIVGFLLVAQTAGSMFA